MNHILISPSGDGHRNLAADEFLLSQYRSCALDGVTLYFYVNSNAVIIGRNQNAWRECNLSRMAEDAVQLVRRHTGGGAVYHDEGNLNFSFIADERLYDKERQTTVVLRALARFGIQAEVNGRNDLTVGGRKFSGCAYGLSGRARAMHGTLLISTDFGRLSEYLRPSKKKLESKGVESVRSRVVDLSEIADVSVDRARAALIEEFSAEYGAAEPLRFSPEDEEQIARLEAVQNSWEWIYGATPRFDYRMDERFSFGELQLLLRLRAGRVEGVTAFTDSLDTSLPARLSELLAGCRFGRDPLAAALDKGGPEAREISAFIAANWEEDK